MDFTKLAGQILRGKVSRASFQATCLHNILHSAHWVSLGSKPSIQPPADINLLQTSKLEPCTRTLSHTDLASCMQILLLPEPNPPLWAGLFFLPKFVMWLNSGGHPWDDLARFGYIHTAQLASCLLVLSICLCKCIHNIDLFCFINLFMQMHT
jgi:hypothetical protein